MSILKNKKNATMFHEKEGKDKIKRYILAW
jgi:hypothetical protein